MIPFSSKRNSSTKKPLESGVLAPDSGMAALYGQRMRIPTRYSSWSFGAINAHLFDYRTRIVLAIVIAGQGRLSKSGAIIDRTISLTCRPGRRGKPPSPTPTRVDPLQDRRPEHAKEVRKENQVEIEPGTNAGMLIEPSVATDVGAFRCDQASAACIYIMYLV
jgi:hypothetical protein